MFLSGGNLPWINYAYDFGNGQWAGVKSRVEDQLKLLHEAGGNSLSKFVVSLFKSRFEIANQVGTRNSVWAQLVSGNVGENW